MATTGKNSPMRYTPGALGAGDGGYGIQKHGVLPNAGRGGQGGPTADQFNAYAHQPNNAINTPDVDVKVEFQPNMLDNYDTVTYHFKLFIVSTDNSSHGRILDTDAQVVIAESGVSDLTIDNVNLYTIAGLSTEAGSGTLTNLDFVINEPGGAGLLDKMYYGSLDLGIGNWTVMPLYLQLEFRGRDPVTSNSAADGAPGALGNMRWIWSIKITDIKANVTTAGTRYSFSAVMYNEVAQSNASFLLQHNITLKDISKFHIAISELEDKLNKDQVLKTLDNYGKPDVYKFVIDPAIANNTINTSNQSTKRNDALDDETKSATFTMGTGIDKIIDTLLSHTTEYQIKTSNAKAPGAEGAPAAEEVDQMKKLWRVITETRPLEYDRRRNDNALEYTVFIIEYDVGVLEVNASQSSGITPAISKKRLLTYANKALLKKKYNYIFTGLNDQIISLDLTFNSAYATALSRYGGIYLNSAGKDYGTVANNNAADERSVTESVRKLISLKNDATATPSAIILATSDYQQKAEAAKLSPSEISKYNKIISYQQPAGKLDRSVFGRNYVVDENQSVSENQLAARQLAQPLGNNIPAFVSDIDVNSPETLESYNSYLKGNSPGGDLRPLAYREAIQNNAVGAGATASSNSGLVKLASVFSNALHSGLDANLVSLKLTIKGDPFWLFPQPILNGKPITYNSLKAPVDAIAFLKNSQVTVPNSVNIYGGDNFMVIRFRTPRPDNTFTNAETFSGVYKVLNIKSRFEMGKFVQDLQCILDPIINLKDISSLIEFDAADQDTPTTVEDFTPTTNYTASKAPSTESVLDAKVSAGVITAAEAEASRLLKSGHTIQSEAVKARLTKVIKG